MGWLRCIAKSLVLLGIFMMCLKRQGGLFLVISGEMKILWSNIRIHDGTGGRRINFLINAQILQSSHWLVLWCLGTMAQFDTSVTPVFCQKPVHGRTSYLCGLLWLTSFGWFINLNNSGCKMLIILVLKAHWNWLCPPGAWMAQCFLNALLLRVQCGVGSTAKVWGGKGLGLSPAGMWTLGTRLFSKCIQFVSD